MLKSNRTYPCRPTNSSTTKKNDAIFEIGTHIIHHTHKINTFF